MRKNEHTMIEGENIILVPYKKHHVLKYHEWMKSPELQKLTGSDPLSLEDEYKMQISWSEDLDKCTFIVLDRTLYENTSDEIAAMIGDTNLFFNDSENSHSAEAEIMIAESEARGKHKGKEAMILMLLYGIEHLEVNKYVVKILADNGISIRMFKNLGFVDVSYNAIFNEVTLEKNIDTDWLNVLNNFVKYNSKLYK